MKAYDDNSKKIAHLKGRISYFIENYVFSDDINKIDLSILISEIEELEAQIDKTSKEVKRRRAETKISKYASEYINKLPLVEPCVGAEIDFNVLKPEVTIIENKTDSILKMSDLGSDQNYLAIHISLSFALQKFFENYKESVPGVLILDQVSRPYFPSTVNDEKEILANNIDEDIVALKSHIDFIFNQTSAIKGLQVILLEHAYFADDERYVKVTKERWAKETGHALIPESWETRADLKK